MANSSASVDEMFIVCYSIVDRFYDDIIFSPNIRDRGNNIIFNTCIRYNEHSVRTIRGILVDIIEIVEMNSSYFSIFVFHYISGKTIGKDIY